MEKISVQIEVTKEVYELASGLAKFVAVVKKEVSDNGGWSMGDDLPAIVQETISGLLPALQGMDKIKDEIAGDKVAFTRGLVVGLADIAEIFVK